jgi:hypothetical protein
MKGSIAQRLCGGRGIANGLASGAIENDSQYGTIEVRTNPTPDRPLLLCGALHKFRVSSVVSIEGPSRLTQECREC